MATGEVWKSWMKEHMFKVTVLINKTNDEDIYTALKKVEEAGESKSAAIKNWTRIGIKAENRKNK